MLFSEIIFDKWERYSSLGLAYFRNVACPNKDGGYLLIYSSNRRWHFYAVSVHLSFLNDVFEKVNEGTNILEATSIKDAKKQVDDFLSVMVKLEAFL